MRPENMLVPQKKPDENPEQKKLTEADFDTKSKIKDRLGEELMDLDSTIQKIYGQIPSTTTEMIYRMELNTIQRVYLVFMVIGLLMVLSVLFYL